jgi:hypothetical protein
MIMFNSVGSAKKTIAGIIDGFQKQIDKLEESALIINNEVAKNTDTIKYLMEENDQHLLHMESAVRLRGKLQDIIG